MVRKRYTVAVVGMGGSTAAQRSEVSRHRRERDAMAAAGDECDRLSIAYGSAARHYRIVVECDGEVIRTLAADEGSIPDDMVTVVDPHMGAVSDVGPEGPRVDDPAGWVDDAPVDEGERHEDTASHPLLVTGSDADPSADDPGDDAEATTEPEAADAPSPDATDDVEDDLFAPSSDAPHPTADQEPEMSDTASAVLPDERSSRRPRSAMPTWDDVPSGPVPAEVLRYFESAVAREEARHASRHRDEADVA